MDQAGFPGPSTGTSNFQDLGNSSLSRPTGSQSKCGQKGSVDLLKKVVTSYVQRMKVAVAMAIIKNKPPDVTGREFTEAMVRDYQESQLNWKLKYESLVDKIQAPQSLNKQQPSMPGISIPVTTSTGANFQQCLPNSCPSLPASQNMQRNPSRNTAGNLRCPASKLTPGAAQNQTGKTVTEIWSLTPPCSYETPLRQPQPHPKPKPKVDTKNKENLPFLEALLYMKNVSKLLEKPQSGSEYHRSVLEHNIIQSVEILAGWMQDPKKALSDVAADQMVEYLVDACDCKTDPLVKDTSINAVSLFIQDMIQTIMDHQQLALVSLQKKRSVVLSSLCKSRSLRTTLSICYIQCIREYAGLLHKVTLGHTQFEPHLYENIYFIFTCLDELIQAEVKTDVADRVFDSSDAVTMHELLEESVTDIAHVFPLFANYIWRIISVIHLLLQM